MPSKIKGAFTTGRVIDVEPAGSDWRITIDNAIANGVETDLLRIRMPAKDKPPELGRGIEFKADILPPFAPTAIGSFDFGLYSYYKKYSGSGRLFDSYKYSSIQYDSRFIDKILFNFKIIKEKLNSAVFSTMSRDEAGVVISMMTGDIYAVSKRVAKNYRAAGISHIISISGFHMSLLAASVFFAVRTFLAFMPFIALRINTKKLAAACAFFATLFYLTLSGARIPAARAFIMTTLGLGAILFDRSVLSMRMVSASAAATLGIWPESLLNPGFWLSFAAVAVLVRLYDSRKNRDKRGGIAKAIKDNITASACIGLAITPFVIYGFNQAQIYAVAGNMIAVPIVSTVA
ncbi:MAG: ComEC/Rec2 family competence protein, partial [Rickettsiales bacterium]|nr:ComEC/Rec2 family competence protein [Rickettsiales bacterium]